MTKYNAKKVTVDGIDFDSKAEAEYYEHITNLGYKDVVVHPRYIIQEKFLYKSESIRPIYYEADFEFRDDRDRVFVVDVKGMATPEAKLKRKLFLNRYRGYALEWVVKYKGGRVNYFENEKRKRENRRLK